MNVTSIVRADHAVKKRIQLENDNGHKEEENDKLENQLKDDKFTLAESERKYEDIARKLATKVGRKKDKILQKKVRNKPFLQIFESRVSDLDPVFLPESGSGFQISLNPYAVTVLGSRIRFQYPDPETGFSTRILGTKVC